MSRSYKIGIVLAVAISAGVFFYHHRHRVPVGSAQIRLNPTGHATAHVPQPPVAAPGAATGIGDLMSRIRSHMNEVDPTQPPRPESIAQEPSLYATGETEAETSDASVGFSGESAVPGQNQMPTLTFGPKLIAPAATGASEPELTTTAPNPDAQAPPAAEAMAGTASQVSVTPVSDPVPPESRTYTVQHGDTFSTIAVKIYGSEQHWIDIATSNPFVDPKRLRVGQEIRLPSSQDVLKDAAQANLHAPGQVVTHVVRPGETLSGIAHRYYNAPERWREIFLINRDTIGHDPDRLQAGDVLRIPPQHVPAR